MADPFRQPGATPTAVALARLEATKADPIHSLCALWVSYREVHNAPALRAETSTAANLAMTYVGSAAEGFAPALKKQIFVDTAGTTQAHISSYIYFFATYFESGRCMLTFQRPPRTQHNERLLSRAGVGDFTTDYHSHCAAVTQWVDGGEVTIVVRDISTAVRLGRLYYRNVLGMQNTLTIVAAPVLMLVLGLAAIGYLFL